MNRKMLLALVVFFICALATAGVIGSIKSRGQDNQNSRGECEQACTQTYQACMGASNSNRAQCQRDMQACRGNCKKSSASPSPEVSPSPSVEQTATVTPTPR
jgi:hypothetical protein